MFKKININDLEFEEIVSGKDTGLLCITDQIVEADSLNSIITILKMLEDHGYNQLIFDGYDACIYVYKKGIDVQTEL